MVVVNGELGAARSSMGDDDAEIWVRTGPARDRLPILPICCAGLTRLQRPL